MAEVLMAYAEPVGDEIGRFRARAIGRHAEDGMWEGWIEFLDLDAPGGALVTGVESRQPEHAHLVYWASGLTPVYLEGALRRARDPVTVRARTVEMPLTDRPAPPLPATPRVVSTGPQSILDPFEIGSRSLDILRQELDALNRPRLLNIIAAHGLNPGGEDLSWMTDAQIAHFIVVAVDTQLLQGRIPPA